jgi:hypothetical protein
MSEQTNDRTLKPPKKGDSKPSPGDIEKSRRARELALSDYEKDTAAEDQSERAKNDGVDGSWYGASAPEPGDRFETQHDPAASSTDAGASEAGAGERTRFAQDRDAEVRAKEAMTEKRRQANKKDKPRKSA